MALIRVFENGSQFVYVLVQTCFFNRLNGTFVKKTIIKPNFL